ncbi:hypothetical protein AVEN_239646-1 [Araneus ventricosus]|uniref:Uncharacterized protein n=1 Tax=Araneus ventricosus TaxID=182803 RepID=A0A4Y2CUI7_ARAVE|nr:hypothetical protein AVEN_239646-1 [Araneus ventricosus]
MDPNLYTSGYKFQNRIFVFALLEILRLDNNPMVKSLLRQRSLIVSKHPPDDKSNCEYSGLHYQGLLELPFNTRFDNDRKFIDIKAQCKFFKSEKAIVPINFLACMQVPPKRIILKNMKEESLLDYLLVTPELIQTMKQKRETLRRNRKQTPPTP